MGIRLLRVIVGILLISTLIFAFIPNIIIWIITDRSYLSEWGEWVVTGE